MLEAYEIGGGAGPYTTAAIVAAVHAALMLEENSAAQEDSRFEPGAWVMAGRPREVVGPTTDFRGLSPFESEGEETSPDES